MIFSTRNLSYLMSVFLLAGLVACGGDEEQPQQPSAPVSEAAPEAEGETPDRAAPSRPAPSAAVRPSAPEAAAPEVAQPRPMPALNSATIYEVVKTEIGDDDSAQVWIYADPEEAVSATQRAETALRAVLDVLDQGEAGRAEVFMLPTAQEAIIVEDITLAYARFDPLTGFWNASSVGGQIDEFVLLSVEILGDNSELFRDEGVFQEEAFATYLARVLFVSPREAQSYLREARRLSAQKTEYNP